MAGILREQESPEVDRQFAFSFDLSAPVLFFPVRHHSPACAFHLEKTFALYRPDCVLVEGPSDADYLVSAIADGTSVPPFAVYCSYDDRDGLVSEEKEKYRAYYPFLAYSPEYAAIRAAAAAGVPCFFMDMPFAARLVNAGEEAPRRRRYDDDGEYERNSYTAALVRNGGFRTYDEFWEAHYELPAGDTETGAFVRSLFHLAFYMRLADGDPGEAAERAETVLRENFMTGKILGAKREFARVMAVAGAYHVPELVRGVRGEGRGDPGALRSYSKNDAAAYLMPYTFAEMDSRKGYAAGMPFPAYYGEIWKGLKEGASGVRRRVAGDFIVKTARFTRKFNPVSIPDEANALSLALSLARLRGKAETGVYELIDGVRSAFVKGDINRTHASGMDYLLRMLSGVEAGKVAASKYLPPIVSDFRKRCGEFRIKYDSVLRQEITLDILKNPAHFQKSRFLHQLVFLETGFCRRLSGPDYAAGVSKNLVREIWEYRCDSKVETVLIDKSVFGAAVAEAAANIAAACFRDSMDAGALGKLLVSVELMGLDDFYEFWREEAGDVIDREGYFTNAASCLESLRYLINLREILNPASSRSDLFLFLERCYRRAVELMDQGKTEGSAGERRACEALKALYALITEAGGGREDFPRLDPSVFAGKAGAILEDGFCSSRFYGTLLAIQGKQGRIDTAGLAGRIKARLAGSIAALNAGRPGIPDQAGSGDPAAGDLTAGSAEAGGTAFSPVEAGKSLPDPGQEAASFIAGFFLVGRDILFADPSILAEIDKLVSGLSDEDFLAALPYFRQAFTAFLPAETDRLGRMAAGLYGLDPGPGFPAGQASGKEFAMGMFLDKKASAAMAAWGLPEKCR